MVNKFSEMASDIFAYIIFWIILVGKSFWRSSITIFWGFIPLLLLGSYRIELLEISRMLFMIRIHLIRYWGYYWFFFFITTIIQEYKEAKK